MRAASAGQGSACRVSPALATPGPPPEHCASGSLPAKEGLLGDGWLGPPVRVSEHSSGAAGCPAVVGVSLFQKQTVKHFILVVFDPVLVKGEVWPRKTRYLETKIPQAKWGVLGEAPPTSSLR